MQLNHINIKTNMPQLEKEKDFFCNILGMQEGPRPQFNNRGFWLYAEEQPIIHLTEDESADSQMHNGHIHHLAFQASEVDTFVAMLKKNNIAFSTNYITATDALQLFLHSPLGIGIEVIFFGESLNT